MTTDKLRYRGLLSLLAVGALLMSACGNGEAATDEGATTSAESSTSIPADVPEALAATDEPAIETQSALTDGSAPCIVGEWLMTESDLSAFYDAVAVAAAGDSAGEGGMQLTIAGEAEIDFAEDGTFEYRPDLVFELSGQAGGSSLDGNGSATGTMLGTFGVVDAVMATTITDDQLAVIINIGGQEFNASDLGADLESVMPFSRTPVDCGGPAPVLLLETSTATGEIFPLELVAR